MGRTECKLVKSVLAAHGFREVSHAPEPSSQSVDETVELHQNFFKDDALETLVMRLGDRG